MNPVQICGCKTRALACAALLAVPGLAVAQTPDVYEQVPAATQPAPLSPAVIPAEPTPAPACKEDPPVPFWTKVPPVRPIQRPGWFIIPPAGPGYYSLRDLLEDNVREDRPALPWAPHSINPAPFYENDFRYLDKPDNQVHDCFDPLKRIHLGDCWLLSLGGEERLRYVNEVSSRLTKTDNNFELLRTRLYADLWYADVFRVYVEYLDAHIYNENLAPLPVDVDRSDLLDLFVDLKVFTLDDKPVYVRGGRQELLYGSQRLISPPDWNNTRRTFQGVKAFRQGEKFDVDVFWVQPVLPDASHFDSPDDDQNFTGVWTTYRPRKGTALDLYYLNLNNAHRTFTGAHGEKGAFEVSTLGSRYSGDWQHILWDVEGMYQWGDWVNQDISAGAATVGLGYQFADLPMNPQFWIYNDWASGDHNPGSGDYGTFNQLFPFGHYYFGALDLVGRQNIDDLNMQLAFFPTKWMQTVVQYHVFRLDSSKDFLYNAAGKETRHDPTGKAGTDVGDEIDLAANFHLSRHQDVFLGYSKLFSGDFIRKTGPNVSPELFYLQYSFRW